MRKQWLLFGLFCAWLALSGCHPSEPNEVEEQARELFEEPEPMPGFIEFVSPDPGVTVSLSSPDIWVIRAESVEQLEELARWKKD